MSSHYIIALKYIRQLGLRPLALFALYRLGLMTGHYKRTSILDTRYSNNELSNIVFLPDREQLAQTLGNDSKKALLKEADEIVAGKFRMFGGDLVPIQLTFDQPLQHWTAYETDPQLLSAFYSQISDIKFLWEPARFGWAFLLGRAYHITQDNQYAEAFWKYFESFAAGNPAYLGPHWMNGQEAALRLMAYVWAREVFETAPASSAERSTALLQSITNHASRITQTLVYARSQNNNHLVTEAAAIYTASLLFKNKTWRALGWRWLNWAFQNQIGGYGEYIQHSANYHRVMLQTALWVNLIKDDDWPRATLQALGRATHWLFSLLDLASGRTPNLGANDGALVFPLSSTPYNDYKPVVQAAARAFIKTQIEPGVWDEMSLWFGLAPVMKTYEPEHYLSDNLRGRESWAYLRASTFKSRLSHADQLHLDLWWRGLNIAQDAGTYLYNAAPPWDNPLVATRVHNTVTVDGRNQMTRGGRFLMLDWFPAYSKSEIAAEEDVLQCLTANHTGYRGIRHERIVTVYANEKWLVEDKLTRRHTVSHVYRLHWLLPDWEYQIRESIFDIRLKSPYGWLTLCITPKPRLSDSEYRVSLIRAGELIYGSGNAMPFEGWASPTYGVKVPALSLAIEVTSLWNVTFTTKFVFPE
ncbi:MAG: heparinase II/III family protein [Anaerolineales bacterium]|nr:heparinase II/III family protein [Anaerolineales bacterium]